MKEKIEQVYRENHREGAIDGKKYDYTCPSPGAYPHQWLWDSCFHAITLTHIDPERSKKEIVTLLSKQMESGFIPCVSIWEKRHPFEEILYMTKITQSPLIPVAVETIYKKTGDMDFVKEVYPKLVNFFNWLIESRDRNKNNLLEIIHPWEAGTDSIPSFDRQLGIKNPKPSAIENFYALFKVLAKYQLMGWNEDRIYNSRIFINENVVFNSIYAKSLLSMVNLSGLMKAGGEAWVFEDRYRKTRKALLDSCWSEDDGLFYDLDQKGTQVKAKSITSLMPLILPDLPKVMVQRLIEEHLLNENEFWTPFPIPSVSVSEKAFNPGRSFILSRGPTWVNTNWFLSKALSEKGYGDIADKITEKTVQMIKKSGFREFYNPFTGEGYGQQNFGWSTLVLDMV